MSNKVLIISYTFPPTGGIGGRRWAKFAKYLLRKGLDVQVLAARYTLGPVSDWQQDIAELSAQKRIAYFNSGYPGYLGIQPKTLFEKLAYRASLLYVKWRIKGNYYDRSAHCRKVLLPLVEQYIQKGYNNIIVTVGPFIYASFVSEIKKKHPGINLILDVRDPWTNNKTSFGYDTLNPERFAHEKHAEETVAHSYDYITAVADDINSYFKQEYRVPEHKLATIRNGFDTDDFPVLDHAQKAAGLTLVFTGTVYNKAIKYVELLAEGLQKLKTENPGAYEAISCHFYGSVPETFNAIANREPHIQFHGNIPLKEVYNVIAGASAAMLFLTDDLAYSFSTKFYEYLSQKKPVIVFSKGGKTGEFAEEHGVGMSITPDNIMDQLTALYNKYKLKQLTINPQFDTRAYSVEHLANQFIPLLKP